MPDAAEQQEAHSPSYRLAQQGQTQTDPHSRDSMVLPERTSIARTHTQIGEWKLFFYS